MTESKLYWLVQLSVFLTFYGLMVSDPINTNLLIYRTCYITLGYNETECVLLGTKNVTNASANLEKIVEPNAAKIKTIIGLIENVFTTIICLFIGPWSDKFGRKPLIILSSAGFGCGYILFTIFSALPNLSPWYSLICTIPIMLSGGISSYLIGMFSYITDITDEETRGTSIAIFEGILFLGIFVANLSSSFLFDLIGYVGVFAISAISFAFVIILVTFTMTETVKVNMVNNDCNKFNGFFKISHIIETMAATFKKRQNNDRAIIIICAIILTICIILMNAESAVTFLYLREKFHWSLEKYTLYSSANTMCLIFGTMIGVYMFNKLLKMPETLLALIGFISLLIGNLLQGLAVSDFMIYAGAAVRCLGGTVSPMIRSLVSKVVPVNECGKVFSFIVTSETSFGMIGSPLYTTIYNATINLNSAIFNFVSVGIYLFQISLILIVILLRHNKSSQDVERLIRNEDLVENNDVENIIY